MGRAEPRARPRTVRQPSGPGDQPRVYNRKTGLCVACAATSQQKGYAFEVVVDETPGRESIVFADHVRHINWRARRAERFRRVSPEILDEALARLSALLFLASGG